MDIERVSSITLIPTLTPKGMVQCYPRVPGSCSCILNTDIEMHFCHHGSLGGCSGIHTWIVKLIKERSTSQMKVAYQLSSGEDELND